MFGGCGSIRVYLAENCQDGARKQGNGSQILSNTDPILGENRRS